MAAPRRLAVLLTGVAMLLGAAVLTAGTTTTAQAGPERRSIHGTWGGRRGAATHPAWTASIAASEGMNPSAMPPE